MNSGNFRDRQKSVVPAKLLSRAGERWRMQENYEKDRQMNPTIHKVKVFPPVQEDLQSRDIHRIQPHMISSQSGNSEIPKLDETKLKSPPLPTHTLTRFLKRKYNIYSPKSSQRDSYVAYFFDDLLLPRILAPNTNIY